MRQKKRKYDVDPKRDKGSKSKVGTSSIDHAMSKVEELNCAVDNSKAQGYEGVNAARDNTIYQKLDHNLHFLSTAMPIKMVKIPIENRV